MTNSPKQLYFSTHEGPTGMSQRLELGSTPRGRVANPCNFQLSPDQTELYLLDFARCP